MKKKELSYGFLLLVNMPRSLLLFLISRSILSAFMRNACNQQSLEYLRECIIKRKHPIDTFILYAFSWKKTPEGYNFWYRRHVEYFNIIKAREINI